MNTYKPTLVLNGTGKIGRRVVERLTARGLPVRIGLRSGEPPFDWEDRSTWNPVLEGVVSVYISHHFDAIPGAAETLGSFAELAVKSGVPRLVLMSGRGEQEVERAERAVRDSGAELTVLHSTWFSASGPKEANMARSTKTRKPPTGTETRMDGDDAAPTARRARTSCWSRP